jgi:ABC-type transport system involved in cytochrome bd biosynthesis fused ATPase/permease subunit
MKGELQRFILRSAALKLYREALRTVRRSAVPHAVADLRREIRARFVEHATEADPAKIRRLLSDGQKELEVLDEMLRVGRG